jgi:hypothetical protein
MQDHVLAAADNVAGQAILDDGSSRLDRLLINRESSLLNLCLC